MCRINTNQSGSINVLLLPVILLALLFIGAAGFGIWAYQGRQDYKNNVTPKIDAAVEVAKQQTSTEKDKEFQEKYKQPLSTYKGPSNYGSISMQYPKTWSGYVSAPGNNDSMPINAFFYPGVVPDIGDASKAFALRFQVVSTNYTEVLKSFQNSLNNNTVDIKPYNLPKVPSVIGVEITGQIIPPSKTGIMVVLPLRDKTLKIWTEGTDYTDDFNSNILPNFTFAP